MNSDPSLARRSDRPWLLISAQPGIHFEFRTVVASLAKAHHDVLNLAGCSRAWDSRLRCRGSRHYKYPDILTEGKFCLVVRAARLGPDGAVRCALGRMHSCGGRGRVCAALLGGARLEKSCRTDSRRRARRCHRGF
ncbi:hypothetical protein MRX96_047962 [Rhipicephalus microplus]